MTDEQRRAQERAGAGGDREAAARAGAELCRRGEHLLDLRVRPAVGERFGPWTGDVRFHARARFEGVDVGRVVLRLHRDRPREDTPPTAARPWPREARNTVTQDALIARGRGEAALEVLLEGLVDESLWLDATTWGEAQVVPAELVVFAETRSGCLRCGQGRAAPP